MDNIPLYAFVPELPAAPEWAIVQGQQKYFQEIDLVDFKQLDQIVIKKDNQHFNNATNHTTLLDKDVLRWCHSNIGSEVIDARYSCTKPGLAISGPHCDQTRNFTLIYLLETGGDDHCTVFFQEKHCDVLRVNGLRANDYSRLDEIARLQLPLNAWTILNARVLHGIENISQGRISLQLNCNQIPRNLKINWHYYTSPEVKHKTFD
jgi:hypothetical protein